MTDPRIWGAPLPEVRRRIGSLGQIARAEELVHTQGAVRGTRVIRVDTGGGLSFDVLPDRALDIGAASLRGKPLSWLSPTGFVAPGLAEQRDRGWLRSFGGGLLATCGLDSFGPANGEGDEYRPLHGRIGSTPARVTRVEVGEGGVVIEGEVRQAGVFAEDLVLRRRITAPLGGTVLRVHDTVTNEAFRPAGHMVLYHCNLGWPLISETTSLDIPSRTVVARDEDAEAGLAHWARFTAPRPGDREQVFRHDLRDRDRAIVRVDSPDHGLHLELRVDTATLPAMHQWKLLDEGHYVLGVEPVNVDWTGGRASAEEAGVVPVLAPGESVAYDLEFVFSEG